MLCYRYGEILIITSSQKTTAEIQPLYTDADDYEQDGIMPPQEALVIRLVSPKHIGFIMDGNGRWAKKRLLPRAAGHREGVKALKRVVNGCIAEGVKCVTMYTFSTENWQRPQNEVNSLMNLIREFLEIDYRTEFAAPVRIKILGDKSGLPEDIAVSVTKIETESACIDGFCIALALNYGSRDELAHAVNAMAKNQITATAENISEYLYTKGLPDPDIIVRTGGEQRLSNFLLFQSAYAELIFMDKLWPDMKEKDVKAIIEEYSNRDRKFGKIK